eukprot:9227560-Ditylum_brightwellii.AAC.1
MFPFKPTVVIVDDACILASLSRLVVVERSPPVIPNSFSSNDVVSAALTSRSPLLWEFERMKFSEDIFRAIESETLLPSLTSLPAPPAPLLKLRQLFALCMLSLVEIFCFFLLKGTLGVRGGLPLVLWIVFLRSLLDGVPPFGVLPALPPPFKNVTRVSIVLRIRPLLFFGPDVVVAT